MNITTRFLVLDLLYGPSWNAKIPLFRNYRIFIDHAVNPEPRGLRENGSRHDDLNSRININSKFGVFWSLLTILPGTPLKVYFVCFRIGFDIAWIIRTAKTPYSSNGQWPDGHRNSIGSITRKCKVYRIQTVKDNCWTGYNDERKWKKSIFIWQIWFSLGLEMASQLLKGALISILNLIVITP